MGKVVVNALAESAWGTFTIGVTIPIALVMGLYMYRLRPGQDPRGHRRSAWCCCCSRWWPASRSPSRARRLRSCSSEHTLTLAIAAYGFIASVLPVWMLLCPRDYLSSYMKIGTIALLIVGIMIVNPSSRCRRISVSSRRRPDRAGQALFPFVFITIACGAISGFHALVG